MRPIVWSTSGPSVLTDVGPAAAFGGLFALGAGHIVLALVVSAVGPRVRVES